MFKPESGNRKLSFSVMLTDPGDYKGGELLLKTSFKPMKTPKKRGTVVFFPSFVLHEVTPVTEGIRKTLVGWVLGPNFR
jgi:PKHD-type hydroxylase